MYFFMLYNKRIKEEAKLVPLVSTSFVLENAKKCHVAIINIIFHALTTIIKANVLLTWALSSSKYNHISVTPGRQ